MKTITYEFKIENGKFICDELETNFDKFKADNEGKSGDVTFKIIRERKVMYWRHKFYRSILLPYIARESYSSDEFQTHIELKKKYLFEPCLDYKDIPEIHKDDRTLFIFGQDDRLRGYVKSTGNLTDDEMHSYLHQVDGIFQDLQIGLNSGKAHIREKAFPENPKKKQI